MLEELGLQDWKQKITKVYKLCSKNKKEYDFVVSSKFYLWERRKTIYM